MKENQNQDEKNKLLEQGKNIWQEIINESTTKKEIEEANIFVFGDKDTGKKSLIRTMNKESVNQDYESRISLNSEENLPLYGLINYSHLTAKKLLDDDSEINKVGVWIMNEITDKNTFSNLIKEKSILKCVCLVVVDYSRPWNIINSLTRWCNFAYESFGNLITKLPLDEQTNIRKQSNKIYFNNI